MSFNDIATIIYLFSEIIRLGKLMIQVQFLLTLACIKWWLLPVVGRMKRLYDRVNSVLQYPAPMKGENRD